MSNVQENFSENNWNKNGIKKDFTLINLPQSNQKYNSYL